MPFDSVQAISGIRSEIPEAFRREWSFLAAPGTWWSGPERVAIAAEARRAMAGKPPEAELPAGRVDVVRSVAVDSPLITADWVADLPERGIDLPAYAEVVGIVARLSSVDMFHKALGLALEPLPLGQPGQPSHTPPPSDLVVGGSYVPMVREVSIPRTISLVPPETHAWIALSDVLYMPMAQMGDPDYRRALHRTQIELVAARTSQVNECFY
jgi:hypothetical protein